MRMDCTWSVFLRARGIRTGQQTLGMVFCELPAITALCQIKRA